MAYHHPGVPNWGDIKSIAWSGQFDIDLLTAGYPCQPFSQAGKRLGEDDPRHLWPFVADAIRITRPRLVLLENVRGHVSKGLDQVLGDLSYLGYLGAWVCVRASDVGAPHRRERLFILAADAQRQQLQRWGNADELVRPPGPEHREACERQRDGDAAGDRRAAPADTSDLGLERLGDTRRRWCGDPHHRQFAPDAECPGLEGPGSDEGWWSGTAYGDAVRRWECALGRPAPEPTVRRVDDGSARRVGDRLSRSQALKILGNGVVPQQAAYAWGVLAPRVEEILRSTTTSRTA